MIRLFTNSSTDISIGTSVWLSSLGGSAVRLFAESETWTLGEARGWLLGVDPQGRVWRGDGAEEPGAVLHVLEVR